MSKFAMSYRLKKKMAKGGKVKGVHEEGMEPGQSTVGEIQRYGKSPGDDYANKASKDMHKAKLSELKSMSKPKLQGLAEGGDVLSRPSNESGEYAAANAYRDAKQTDKYPEDRREAVAERNKQFMKKGHERTLEKIKSQPKPKLQGLADGGTIQQDPIKTASAQDSMRKAFKFAAGGPVKKDKMSSLLDPDVMGEEDMIDRIMAKHQEQGELKHKVNEYSKGGQVANETDIDSADHDPAQFDDLVLNDDLESDYDGDNAGDHLGNEQHEEDNADLVGRIMKSMAKKDKKPNPA